MKREEIPTVDEAIKFSNSRSAPIADLKEPVKTLGGQLIKTVWSAAAVLVAPT